MRTGNLGTTHGMIWAAQGHPVRPGHLDVTDRSCRGQGSTVALVNHVRDSSSFGDTHGDSGVGSGI